VPGKNAHKYGPNSNRKCFVSRINTYSKASYKEIKTQ
jgi:hypothetical protein